MRSVFRFIRAVCAIGTIAIVGSCGPSWAQMTPHDADFSIEFPGTDVTYVVTMVGKEGIPVVVSSSDNPGLVGPTPGKDDVVSDLYMLKRGDVTYAVVTTTKPKDFKLTKSGKEIADIESLMNGVTQESEKEAEKNAQKVSLSGHAGYRIRISKDGVSGEALAVKIGTKTYIALYAAKDGSVDANMKDHFLNSFKILKG